MASKVGYINEGFTSGEISPEMHGHVHSELYKNAAGLLQNMVAVPQGPAIRRGGIRYICNADHPEADKGHRLIPFKISNLVGAVLHVGPDTISVYDANGPVRSVGTGFIVNTNPNFTQQLAGWVERNYFNFPSTSSITYSPALTDVAPDLVKPSAHFVAQRIYSVGAPYTTQGYFAALAQMVELQPSTQYTFAFKAESPTPAQSVQLVSTGNVRVVEVSSPGNFFPTATSYVTNVLATLPFSISALTGTVTFTTPAWGASRFVHIEINMTHQGFNNLGGSRPVHLVELDAYVTNCSLTRIGAAGALVTFPSPWIGYDISELSWAQAPQSAPMMILAHRDVPVQKLEYAGGIWSLAAQAFVGAPWGPTEYPGVVGFCQSRMCLAGSIQHAERVWASKTFSFFDFTPGSNPADSFYGDLDEYGRILWLRPKTTLVVGAESGLWNMTEFSGFAFGPGNVKMSKISSQNSSNTAPAKVGTEIVYTGLGNSRVFGIDGTMDTAQNKESELSFTARHLMQSGIRDMAWAEYPNQTLWGAVPDIGYGSMVGITHSPKYIANAAWSRHNTDGIIEALTSISLGGVDYAFFLVNRTDGKYIGVMDWSVFLDAFVVRVNSPTSATVTGLSHLEGRSVYAVTGDGIIYGPHTVTSGAIVLADAVSSVSVGQPFTSKLITNRPEGISSIGLAQGTKQRWNKIFVRLSPGIRPMINGTRPPERSINTPMNQPEQAAYEDVEISNLGWSDNGTIAIEEFLPKQLTISAVFGQITSEAL